MPSFDIVSELDMQEVDNAINQVIKEMASRFDFKGGKSSVELDKTKKSLLINAEDDMKLRAIHQMIELKFSRRELDPRSLEYGKEEEASHNAIRQNVTLKSGIDKDAAKKITKLIKESGLKVQAQIQDEQIRVTGKKIDDLQATIQMIKTSEVGLPLQFINMRS